MLTYINISFDYPHVIETPLGLEIDPEVKTLWGTGFSEFHDDRFAYSKGAKVIVVAGNWYFKEDFTSRDWKFAIWRNISSSKHFYETFLNSNSEKEAEILLLRYCKNIYQEILKRIEIDNKESILKWREPIRFDLIIHPTSWFTLETCVSLRKYLHIPLVSTLHVDEEILQSIDAFWIPWKNLILSKDIKTKKVSDWIIAKNDLIHLKSLAVNPHSVSIFNEISVLQIDINKILKKKQERTLLYVWRISFEKWFDRFAQIVDNLQKIGLEFNVHIFWDSLWWDARLEKWIKILQCYSNVHFHGFVWWNTLFEYYGRAAMLILPSRSEVFNQTIMEAMYFWVFVLATNVGWAKIQIPDAKFWTIVSNELNDDEIIQNIVIEIKALQEWGKQLNRIWAHEYIKNNFTSDLNRNKRYSLFNEIKSNLW